MVDHGLFLRQTKPRFIAKGRQRCGDEASEGAYLPRSQVSSCNNILFEKTNLGAGIHEPVVDTLL